jgi:uncharacterized protein
MKKLLTLVLSLTITLFGASFDCSKAKTNIEKMICSDKELSVMDENLSKTFKEAIKTTKDKNQLKNKQFAWLKERNECNDLNCLYDSYNFQLKYLENKAQYQFATDQKKITRPTLMSEALYADTYYSEAPSDSLVWSKALLGLKITGFSPQMDSNRECNYKSGLVTLREIQSQLGKDSPYVKLWAANQNRVFSACEGGEEDDATPIQPVGKLPQRAKGDFLYQLGSWNFYRKDYQTALANYKEVERLNDSPQRPMATYMVVRTLAYQNHAEEAYHKIGEILADPSLKSIHDIAKNYRFVIMSNMRSFDLELTPELAIEHLNWLQKIVRLSTENIEQPEKAFTEQKDALAQFNVYFAHYAPDSKAVDWWLRAYEPEGPRMRAVKTLAPQNPLIDWMQAKWAYNVFDYDWLWSLHQQGNPYWEQNRNIVIHAFNQWKKSKDGAWLQIAIKRVHPKDDLASKILYDAEPYLKSSWKNETPEYRIWLFDLWSNMVRIRLGRGEIDKADTLIFEHWDYYQNDLLSFPESMEYSYRRNDFSRVLNKTLQWFVYTGRLEDARSMLDGIQKKLPNDFDQWRSLLATTPDEAISVAILTDYDRYGLYEHNNDDKVWREMIELLPFKLLYTMATNDSIKREYRGLIARSLFTRAVLLEYDSDQIDKYAALAAKLNPSIREPLLESVAGHNRDKYIEFLLKMPRFRPALYLEYAADPERKGEENGLKLDAIDVYNHNDNNWWCRFDDEMFKKRIFNAMMIVPNDNNILSFNTRNRSEDQSQRSELEPYLDNQRKLLNNHPYMVLIDKKEIEALESIPSGPKYLSEAVIKREIESGRATTAEEQNERAANLNRAVRTTRYGCNFCWLLRKDSNCSHGEYSKKAYDLLHERYENTPWAKATPYWFK